ALQRDTVPLSDGAGEVMAIGAHVRRFRVGERVLASFMQTTPPGALGSPLDGCLREEAVFAEDGLLHVPEHLSFEEAATLPCAGVTAWNALMYGPRPFRPGDTVLTLGTGGVSLFALQIAKLGGARVIITSSSDEKLERARALGADDCINYRAEPDWDKAVARVTGGAGADHVLDTGGLGTLARSYRSIGNGGVVSVIGAMTKPDGDLSPYSLMPKAGLVRGIAVGTHDQLRTLVRAVEVNALRPVVQKIYPFHAAMEAFMHAKSGDRFGKVVVRI
ncbi:MAG: NAD(P)-dependent alcohol dehydrogenase, partial [Comamonadaceae bacterium]